MIWHLINCFACVCVKQMEKIDQMRHQYFDIHYLKDSGVSVSEFMTGICTLALTLCEKYGEEALTQQPWMVLLALAHLPRIKKYQPLFDKYGDVIKEDGTMWNEKHHHEGKWLATMSSLKRDLHYVERKYEPKRKVVKIPTIPKDRTFGPNDQMYFLNAQVPFSYPKKRHEYVESSDESIPPLGRSKHYRSLSQSLSSESSKHSSPKAQFHIAKRPITRSQTAKERAQNPKSSSSQPRGDVSPTKSPS